MFNIVAVACRDIPLPVPSLIGPLLPSSSLPLSTVLALLVLNGHSSHSPSRRWSLWLCSRRIYRLSAPDPPNAVMVSPLRLRFSGDVLSSGFSSSSQLAPLSTRCAMYELTSDEEDVQGSVNVGCGDEGEDDLRFQRLGPLPRLGD